MTLRLWPRSLAGQLVALLLATLVVAQAVTTLILADNRRSAVQAAIREQVLGRTAALVRLIEDTPADIHARILQTAGSARLTYAIADAPSVAVSQPPPGEDFAAATLADIFGPDREVRAEIADRDWRPRNRPPRDNDGAERNRRPRLPTVALSVRLVDGRWLNADTILPNPVLFAWPTLMSTLLIAASMVLVVGLSVRRITNPLRRLADAADRLGRGETVPELPEVGPEEVRRSTRAFNAMQARVRRYVSDRTRMLAAVSHDLRTPLTALRLRAEFIDDPEIRDKIVDAVDEMNRMTEATLAFARDDAAHDEARPTDLAALVRAVADDFSDLGESVSVEGPARLDRTVRPVALRRAVRNLVENALRYGKVARIRLTFSAGEVAIAVEDDGPGIPLDKMEEVFEPFTRLETSRSQETGGVGLGLATTRSIVRAHGGEVALANRPEGGLTATIRLPVGP